MSIANSAMDPLDPWAALLLHTRAPLQARACTSVQEDAFEAVQALMITAAQKPTAHTRLTRATRASTFGGGLAVLPFVCFFACGWAQTRDERAELSECGIRCGHVLP